MVNGASIHDTRLFARVYVDHFARISILTFNYNLAIYFEFRRSISHHCCPCVGNATVDALGSL